MALNERQQEIVQQILDCPHRPCEKCDTLIEELVELIERKEE